MYVWGTTGAMCALALTAHFLLENDKDITIASHGQQSVGEVVLLFENLYPPHINHFNIIIIKLLF